MHSSSGCQVTSLHICSPTARAPMDAGAPPCSMHSHVLPHSPRAAASAEPASRRCHAPDNGQHTMYSMKPAPTPAIAPARAGEKEAV